MNQIYTKKNRNSYVYCIILLIILVSWTSQTTAPPGPVRILYLIAVMIIPFVSQTFMLPAALSCFLIVSKNGFAYSYLPQGDYNYSISLFLVFLLLFLISKTSKVDYHKIPGIIVIMLIYVLFVDFVNNGSIEHLFHCLFVVIMFFLLSNIASDKTDHNENIKIFALFLSLGALALYYFYFRFGYMFSIVYKHLGQETIGWTDPNYFSSTIGMAVLSSMIILFNLKTTIIEKILFIITIVVGFFIMVRCASRGAVLAIAISGSFLLLFSNLKAKYKFFILILVVAFVLILFTNGAFQLLQDRIEADTTMGTGRVGLWKKKLQLFFQVNNPLYLTFGMGAHKGLYLGGSSIKYHSFHNDFVAYLVCYGFIGLILFVLFLLSPIKKVSKKSPFRPAVIASVIYLVVCSITLNPLSEGYLAYFCFYFFIHQLCLGETIVPEGKIG